MTRAQLVEFWREVNWRRPWGYRSTEYGTGYHRGKDLAGGYAKPVYALTSGNIVKTGFSSNIGHYIVVDTGRAGDARYEIYCHMFDGAGPKSGYIKAGDYIGRLAVEGESTGSSWRAPHLHFVVTGYIDGAFNTKRVTLNPDPYILNALAGTSGGGSTPFDPTEDDLTAEDTANIKTILDVLIPLKAAWLDGNSVTGQKSRVDVVTEAALRVRGAETLADGSPNPEYPYGDVLQWIRSDIKNKTFDISPDVVKAIADATAAQISPTAKIDYDKVADTVRERFRTDPLK